MTKSTKTREEWLNAAAEKFAPWFKDVKHPLPKKLRVSCGFPHRAPRAIGQCFDKTSSHDDTFEVFICPTQDDTVRVLDILLHELIHAAVGIKEGHKGKFKDIARGFGLKGRLTATFAEEGSELHGKLLAIAKSLGNYPHKAIKKSKTKKGGNGWVRLISVNDVKYTLVMSEKNIDEHGVPVDPWGDEMELKNAANKRSK